MSAPDLTAAPSTARNWATIRVRHAPVAVAMLGFGAVALFGVLVRPLLPIDETRYLAVAWEMHLSGDWVVPHLNGEIYGHKPPLLFWIINLVWSVFGVSETAARLIGPAFGMAAIGLTGALAARLRPQDPAAAGGAALALAGMIGFAVFAGLTMFDAMLTTAVVAGVLALTSARSPGGWIGFGAALALGVLSKGPVALVHLLPMALLTPVWAGITWRRMASGLALGLATALVLVGLWLVPALIQGGAAYRVEVLWTQSAGRMIESFAHMQPWWFYLPLLPVLLWPWVWSLDVWREMRRVDPKGPTPVWAGATLLAFSAMSGKQAHYLLPALPAAALLVGDALCRRPFRAPAAALLPAALGIVLIAAASGRLPGDIVVLARPGWLVAGLGMLFIWLATAALCLRGRPIAILGLALVTLVNAAFLTNVGKEYDAGRIADLLAPHEPAGIGVLGSYAGEFTFAGRLHRPVAVLGSAEASRAWLEAQPGRILLARAGNPDLAAPPATATFRGRRYGLWTLPEMPESQP